MDSAGERFEAIRAALADRNNILTVKDLCELAGVSRSGYYNWVRSEKSRELRGSPATGRALSSAWNSQFSAHCS